MFHLTGERALREPRANLELLVQLERSSIDTLERRRRDVRGRSSETHDARLRLRRLALDDLDTTADRAELSAHQRGAKHDEHLLKPWCDRGDRGRRGTHFDDD